MFSHISFVCYKIICSFTAENHQNSPNIPETQTLIFLSCRGLVSITLECLFFCQLLSLSLSLLFIFLKVFRRPAVIKMKLIPTSSLLKAVIKKQIVNSIFSEITDSSELPHCGNSLELSW